MDLNFGSRYEKASDKIQTTGIFELALTSWIRINGWFLSIRVLLGSLSDTRKIGKSLDFDWVE